MSDNYFNLLEHVDYVASSEIREDTFKIPKSTPEYICLASVKDRDVFLEFLDWGDDMKKLLRDYFVSKNAQDMLIGVTDSVLYNYLLYTVKVPVVNLKNLIPNNKDFNFMALPSQPSSMCKSFSMPTHVTDDAWYNARYIEIVLKLKACPPKSIISSNSACNCRNAGKNRFDM